MSRITKVLENNIIEGKKSLSAFITAGDPDISTTIRLVHTMAENGADIIELGIPFSDPTAEGPVIQRASERALKNNLKLKVIYNAVSEIRKTSDVPIVFMLYYNIIFKFGIERFFKGCHDSGVNGVIIPDLPFEEKGEISDIALKYGVDVILLVAPTSDERVEKIAIESQGFLYCVSSLGVTGTRSEFSTDFDDFFSRLNKVSKIPKLLGFGISTSEQVKRLKGYCDGVIVGSAIVKKIEESEDSDKAVEIIGNFICELRQALDSR
jgi:tryptophan synthase alpha chain